MKNEHSGSLYVDSDSLGLGGLKANEVFPSDRRIIHNDTGVPPFSLESQKGKIALVLKDDAGFVVREVTIKAQGNLKFKEGIVSIGGMEVDFGGAVELVSVE